MMQRRTLAARLAATTALWMATPSWAQAPAEAPDALVKRLSADLLETIKADPELRKGNIARISQVVDTTVMSPRAPMVYTFPTEKETPVRVITFVVEPT
jgi:phospholipid transport system substrate-binding protein